MLAREELLHSQGRLLDPPHLLEGKLGDVSSLDMRALPDGALGACYLLLLIADAVSLGGTLLSWVGGSSRGLSLVRLTESSGPCSSQEFSPVLIRMH